MYDLYTVLENMVLFISKDVVYKVILPCMFIMLTFDMIRYLFSKDSKKEDILESLQGKAIGFTVLVLLPFIMLWFVNFLGKVTGAPIDVDTSIIQKLFSSNKSSVSSVASDSVGNPE